MGHTPFGYQIQNGTAVIDAAAADQLRVLYAGYRDGMTQEAAAAAAGLHLTHSCVGRLLRNQHYVGDDFYPAIIDHETYEQVQTERVRRSAAMGRLHLTPKRREHPIATQFHMQNVMEHYDDPARQAEYIYSLLEREEVE